MQSKTEQIIRRFLMVSSLALALPVSSAMAAAPSHGDADTMQMAGRSMHAGMEHHYFAMLRKLDLSAEQQKQLRLLRDAQSDALRPIERNLREEHIALRDVASADSYDAKKAAEISERIGRLHGQMALSLVEGHRKVLDVLTPEQRAKLNTLVSEHNRSTK
ncbi:Spy/CpxP family protein refolding chaperone [Uliginosibacterium gangwonense]|uniref:Spy/CpxP family protein refolding chaperone n=1 Tax=Uliginosibacterium gangwonense TaxID=392736 RepID=UPI0003708313|nr:Spy/CpxP family protein refolding chaperone [Uliginosibacterium gangwonense]